MGTVARGQTKAHLALIVILLALPLLSLSSSLGQRRRRRRLLGWVRLGSRPLVRGLVPGATSSLLNLDLTRLTSLKTDQVHHLVFSFFFMFLETGSILTGRSSVDCAATRQLTPPAFDTQWLALETCNYNQSGTARVQL